MDKQEIYEALDPAWWTITDNSWNTQFASAVINFSNGSDTTLSYTSSAPIATGGLNSPGPFAPNEDLADTINRLMLATAQRLYDMHCTEVISASQLPFAYGATA